MDNDNVSIDINMARALIADQFPEYASEEIVSLPQVGTVNAIFRIGSRFAARFPLRLMDETQCTELLRAESAAMEELRRYCPYPSPKPVARGRPSSIYPMPWVVQSWIEGETATPTGLSNSAIFSLDLVRLVTSLRQADLGGRRFSGYGRGGDLREHDEWMETCFSNSTDLLDVGRLRLLWRALRELPPSGPDVMSHKDLIPANLLVAGERLVGVLDGGSFGPADPALDLVVAWHLLDRARRAVFREAIQADELEWRRGAAWAFQQAMGLVWYYQFSNPVMSALGKSTISRLLEDLAD